MRPSGAALHLDLFEQPASFSASGLEVRQSRADAGTFRYTSPGGGDPITAHRHRAGRGDGVVLRYRRTSALMDHYILP